MDQRAKAERLRSLHVPGEPLVLLNAWDAGSAAVIAKAGAQAIATTSAGAANALGYPDGQLVTREQMLSTVAPIAAAVDLPVTRRHGSRLRRPPEDAAATARGLVDAGGVGLNLEDTADAGDDPLLPIDGSSPRSPRCELSPARHGRRARPQRAHRRLHRPGRRPGDTARARRRTGPGVPRCRRRLRLRPCRRRRRRRSKRSSQGIGGPVSILAVPGSPSLAELAALGVARVSVGSGAYRAALALAAGWRRRHTERDVSMR